MSKKLPFLAALLPMAVKFVGSKIGKTPNKVLAAVGAVAIGAGSGPEIATAVGVDYASLSESIRATIESLTAFVQAVGVLLLALGIGGASQNVANDTPGK